MDEARKIHRSMQTLVGQASAALARTEEDSPEWRVLYAMTHGLMRTEDGMRAMLPRNGDRGREDN